MNEKVQWRKVFAHNPQYVEIADKYRVRSFLKELLGDEIDDGLFAKLLLVTDDANSIDFASLPDAYILKPTHGSGWVEIIHKGDNPNSEYLRRICSNWLSRTYGYRYHEWAYLGIKPQIVAEELVTSNDGMLAGDVKFYVLGGRVETIYRVENRFGDMTESYLDRNWVPSNTTASIWGADKPYGYKEIFELAEKIGAHSDYIRVDFLSTDSRYLLNELTLYSQSGYDDWSKFFENPFQHDLELGGKWDLKIPEASCQ